MATILSLTSLLDSIASLTLVGWLLRVTLLAAVACAYLAIARRTQPAMRHAVAVGALAALVVLPVASKLLPSLPVPVLPAKETAAPVVVSAPVDADPAPVTIDVSSAIDAARQVGAIDTPATEPSEEPVQVVQPPVEEKSTLGSLAGIVKDQITSQITSATNWTRFGLVLWMLVATGLLVRLAFAFGRARSMANRAIVSADENLRVEVDRACRVLGVTRFVDVAISNEIRIPMVCGLSTPRVILPAGAYQWSRERLAIVLLHEIAHIRRRDCVTMMFARVVNAVLWFHPLVFVLKQNVRRESERACDDLVLATGVRGSDYAEHLIAIARMSSIRRDPLAGATLAFAARSTLEQRVSSILSARRRVTSRRVIGIVAIAAIAVFVATAAVHPTESKSAVTCDNTLGVQINLLDKDRIKLEHKIQNKLENKIQRIQSQIDREAQSSLNNVCIQSNLTNAIANSVESGVNVAVENGVNVAIRNGLENGMKGTNIAIQNGLQKGFKFNFQPAYRLAGNDDDNEDDGESWYDRAHTYYMRGQWEKAGRAYDNAARFGYNRGTAYYNAGCSWALAKKTAPAMDALENAYEEGFDDIDMYASDEDLNSLRADTRFKKLMEKIRNSEEGDGDRRAANREYDRLAAKKTIEDGDWNEVGIELLRAGEYDRAAMAFDNEFKHSKNQDEDALYNKACARALDGKNDEALRLLDQAIAAGSVNYDHMAEDADLVSLHKNKKFDELLDLAEDLELSYPGFSGDSWNVNGHKFWKNGGFDEEKHWSKSLSHFKEMANKHPQYARAWFNLGYAQLKSGDAASCTPNFQKALDMGFKPPTMMYNMACSTAQEGKIDVAFNWLDKSEKAGFEVWNSARYDEDLDPLKADPRWRELKKRWREEERKTAEAHGVHIDID